ncbi:MAG: heme o synthase [Terriglobia bacterium]
MTPVEELVEEITESGMQNYVVPSERGLSRVSDYVCLTKPEVTFLVLIATGLGSYMAAAGALNLWTLFHAVLGTALVAGGTATLNHYLERDLDGRMRRTAQRPLPSGRLTPREVLSFGIVLSVLGGVYLAVFLNWLTCIIGILTLLSYLLIYTPLKQKTSWATFIGAFPGAAPVLMGWTAVRGSAGLEAWVLYALLFAWQFPHFLAIAWIYKEDYARAGLLMLPQRDPEGDRAFLEILATSLTLVPLSLVPTALGMTGAVYFFSALILSLGLLFFALRASIHRSRLQAKVLLHVTVIYLPLIYAMMVLDKA